MLVFSFELQYTYAMYFETGRDNSKHYARQDNLCAPHFHQSVEILYVLRGEKKVFIGDGAYVLQSHDTLVCSPYVMHHFLPDKTGEQIVVTCPVEYCPQFGKLCERMQPSVPVFHDYKKKLLPLFLLLENCHNEILFTGLVNTILGKFIQQTPFIPLQKSRERTLVERIVSYLDEHYTENVTLRSLAKEFGYSPNYFSYIFKRHFHSGLPEYLGGVRIRKSIPLLKTRNVSDVYFLCGFNSPQQYFLHFKKTYGCTPKEFLQNAKRQ